MQGGWAAQRRPGGTGCLKWGVPPNNAMQLTRGVWMRMEASLSARVIVIQGKVVRPSQLIASVRWTCCVIEAEQYDAGE
jgi:hypothetical protein